MLYSYYFSALAYDSQGTEFVFAFPMNFIGLYTNEQIYAIIANDNDQQATISVRSPYSSFQTKQLQVPSKDRVQVCCWF